MSQIKSVETIEIGNSAVKVNLCCKDQDANRHFYLWSVGIEGKMQSYIKDHNINPAKLGYIEVIQTPELQFKGDECLLPVSIIAHDKSGRVINNTLDQFNVYPRRPDSFWEWDSPEDNEAYNGL